MIEKPRIPQEAPGAQEAEGTAVILPPRRSGFDRSFLAMWLAAWGLVELALLGSCLSALKSPSSGSGSSVGILLTLLVVFTGTGLLLAWRLKEATRSREILSITPDRLVVHRAASAGPTREFDRAQIQHLHLEPNDSEPPGKDLGREQESGTSSLIAFRYQGESCRIAQGLDRHQAKKLLYLLRR